MNSLSSWNFMSKEEKEKINPNERHYIENLSDIDMFHRIPSIDKLIEYVRNNRYNAYALKEFNEWEGAIVIKINIVGKEKSKKIQKYCILKVLVDPSEQGFYFALHNALGTVNDTLFDKNPIKYFYAKDIHSIVSDEIERMNKNGIKGRYYLFDKDYVDTFTKNQCYI